MDVITERDIKSAFSRYFSNVELKTFKILAQGAENTSIYVDIGDKQVVLRFWSATHPYMGVRRESDIRGELALMKYFYDNGLPIPEIYRTRDGKLYDKNNNGETYAVMAYVPGDTPQNYTPDMISQIGKAMGKMHALASNFNFPEPRSWHGATIEVTSERCREYIESHQQSMDESDRLIIDLAKRYLKSVAAANLKSLPKAPIHGDIMGENIRFVDGKLAGIFDFDDCRFSYFLEDIAKSIMFNFESATFSMFGADGRNVDIFLDAYESERKLTSHEKELVTLFLVDRLLYQYTRYILKVKQGKSGFGARIPETINRYKQNKKFFELKA